MPFLQFVSQLSHLKYQKADGVFFANYITSITLICYLSSWHGTCDLQYKTCLKYKEALSIGAEILGTLVCFTKKNLF